MSKTLFVLLNYDTEIKYITLTRLGATLVMSLVTNVMMSHVPVILSPLGTDLFTQIQEGNVYYISG